MSFIFSRAQSSRPWLLPACLVFLLAFAAYGNSLSFGFIWDDENLIRNNVYLTEFRYWPQLWTQNIGAGAELPYTFYRPVQMMSYWFDYQLWRLYAPGYHFVNVLWHALTALIFFGWVRQFSRSVSTAFWAAAFFAVHPVHTEAVTYIAGRADLISAFFMIAALVLLGENKDRPRAMPWLAFLSFLGAILAKESALILPLLAAVVMTAARCRVAKGWWIACAATAVLYMALRLTLLKDILIFEPHQGNSWQRLPGFLAASAQYARLLIWPADLHMGYGLRLFQWTEPAVLAGILLVVLSGAAFSYALGKGERIAALGIAWFWIALLPVSNLFLLNAYMAEHWLYVPSMGIFLAAARCLDIARDRLRRWAAVWLLAMAGLGALTYLTIAQNEVWRDPVVFFKRTLRYAPESLALKVNLGIAYQNAGQLVEAQIEFEQARTLSPDHYFPHLCLGNLFSVIGRTDASIESYERALELNPKLGSALNNVAVLYYMKGDLAAARSAYQKARAQGVRMHPEFVQKMESSF